MNEHALHIAQLVGRGIIWDDNSFVEGYGNIQDMGIKFKIGECDCYRIKY